MAINNQTLRYNGNEFVGTNILTIEDVISNELAGIGEQPWSAVDINNDGQQVAVVNGGRVYFKNDGFWEEVFPNGNVDGEWTGCAINCWGNLIVCEENGSVYTRINGVWNRENANGGNPSRWADCDINSSNNLVAVNRDAVWVKGSSNWSEERPALNNGIFYRCAIADTNDVVVGSYGGRLQYKDFNNLTNPWVEITPYGSVDVEWSSVDISPNGLHVIAAAGTYNKAVIGNLSSMYPIYLGDQRYQVVLRAACINDNGIGVIHTTNAENYQNRLFVVNRYGNYVDITPCELSTSFTVVGLSINYHREIAVATYHSFLYTRANECWITETPLGQISIGKSVTINERLNLQNLAEPFITVNRPLLITPNGTVTV